MSIKSHLLDCTLVFIGGGLGALIRVLTDLPEMGPFMPSNFAACFLMGLSTCALKHGLCAYWWYRPLIHTGLFGGLSTFSALSLTACVAAGNNIWSAAFTLSWLLLIFIGCALLGYGSALLTLRRHGKL